MGSLRWFRPIPPLGQSQSGPMYSHITAKSRWVRINTGIWYRASMLNFVLLKPAAAITSFSVRRFAEFTAANSSVKPDTPRANNTRRRLRHRHRHQPRLPVSRNHLHLPNIRVVARVDLLDRGRFAAAAAAPQEAGLTNRIVS